jgi:hypothetical protein
MITALMRCSYIRCSVKVMFILCSKYECQVNINWLRNFKIKIGKALESWTNFRLKDRLQKKNKIKILL